MASPVSARWIVSMLLLATGLSATAVESASPVDVNGARIELVDYQGPGGAGSTTTPSATNLPPAKPISVRLSTLQKGTNPNSGSPAWPTSTSTSPNVVGQH